MEDSAFVTAAPIEEEPELSGKFFGFLEISFIF